MWNNRLKYLKLVRGTPYRSPAFRLIPLFPQASQISLNDKRLKILFTFKVFENNKMKERLWKIIFALKPLCRQWVLNDLNERKEPWENNKENKRIRDLIQKYTIYGNFEMIHYKGKNSRSPAGQVPNESSQCQLYFAWSFTYI